MGRVANPTHFVVFIFVIAVIALIDSGSLPHSIRAICDFPNGNKVEHFILFGLLEFFITRAFLSSIPSRRFDTVSERRTVSATARGWVTLLIDLILALFIGLEEFSQKFFANRTFDLIDLFASYAGLFVGGWMANKTKRP